MRILQMAPPWFAVPPAAYGGIEWVVAELADGLAARGHDVTLLASGGSRTHARLWSVFDEPPSEAIGSVHPEVLHAAAGYRRQEEFDIVHDHSGLVGAAIASFADGPPVVHTLHGPWSHDLRSLYEALPPRLHLVAISEDQRRQAPRGVPVSEVVPNGIPLERFPLRRERRGTDGYLLFVGRANPEKAPDVAVRCATRLGRHLKMIVKVNEEEERAYWREAVEPLLGDADVDVRTGVPEEEKTALMAGADALLFPIRWAEPFGLVMVEAMACGTPVVAYANGASSEVVTPGESGFLVPEGDLEGFCAAVARVGEIDPSACRSCVEERYAAERMVAGYEGVYERLLRAGASPGEDDPASEIIARLGLAPHPEGGWFAESWRDEPQGGGRGAGSAIYFLLRRGEVSRWHRVDAAEVWHFYGGDPLELRVATDGDCTRQVLGADVADGQRPQAVVPPGAWQSARSLGAYTLVGATVSPAFVFGGFELAPPDWEPGGP